MFTYYIVISLFNLMKMYVETGLSGCALLFDCCRFFSWACAQINNILKYWPVTVLI